jgi:DNA mismatch endonuclease, patch repair protein
MAKAGAGRPASVARVARNSASWASSETVRAQMQRQKTRDTTPELAVRKLLHAAGLRYRVDAPPLPGMRRRADVVFGPSRIAVFVDGCFWHGCPDHGARPTVANHTYWSEKIARNKARDEDTDARLQEAGWLSIRVWEHEPPEAVASLVMKHLRLRRI